MLPAHIPWGSLMLRGALSLMLHLFTAVCNCSIEVSKRFYACRMSHIAVACKTQAELSSKYSRKVLGNVILQKVFISDSYD